MAYKFCDEKSIPYKKCGKLIVALNEGEIGGLENLFDRSQKNNCRDISVVNAERIREIEPHCQGIKAIWSPHTGIVDWAVVTLKMAEDFKQMGGDIELGWTLNKIEESSNPQSPIKLVDSKGKEIFASYVITCAGLYSDRIAQLSGGSELPKIIPFRGEYLKLKPEKRYLVKQSNIYPVPDPRFPFLGVHFTPTIYGDVILGPNAVMAFSRRTGVRAQALDIDGNLVDEFVYDSGKGPLSSRIIHVRNAPSPAATSSLAIAEMILEKCVEQFGI
uniref:L-2-hydroxyglutarate dehydrogenase, mitochondrial n=1 Tax=Meloidogyne javanica TaxID=6303 RepID=A0A915LPF0_MELJA